MQSAMQTKKYNLLLHKYFNPKEYIVY